MTELSIDDIVKDIENAEKAAGDNTSPESITQIMENENQATDTETGTEVTETPEQLMQVDNFDEVVNKLLDTITPLSDLRDPFVALIYGDPGGGKTVSSCAHKRGTLFVNIERGAMSLKNHPELMYNKDGSERIKIMEYVNYKQLMATAEALRRGYWPEHEVVVLDTFSALAKFDLDFVVQYSMNKKNIRADEREMYIPAGKDDYQPNIERMRRLASAFVESGRDIIFVCHAKEEKTKRGEIVQIRPDLSPTLAKHMYRMCSVIGYQYAELDNKGVHRKLQIQPDLTVVAKTRVGGLPDTVNEPNMHTLFEAYTKMNEGAKNNDNAN